ncbi:aminoglycoside phosphotransferase family protein [Actinoplanes sp. TRM 88003]|uniref:Aminoglycoside phosphotransferase family protein n=1 Tax=Paractinoplanes aksuensis TaxID=2939490 RepID=A0ABT1DWK3_9ACTN|nr:phosphotransferase [Actinoplanes aksuensis]MCO8275252.1 aminoglycoside phosphotransferase family protein [Actinoplanes aksuensis]
MTVTNPIESVGAQSVVGAGRGRQDLAMEWGRVADRFGLGALTAEPVRVVGGLSNELWRVVTADGTFAVKRMVVNAEQPQFVGNVEGAFRVESHAWAAGIAMPEPIGEPGTGRALVRVGGELFRVHHWVEGWAATDVAAARGAELLAGIHEAGGPRWEVVPDIRWDGSRWSPELAELGDRVGRAPDRMLMVDSHRDLDRKNALVREDGQLLALDWDAAGPIGAIHEVVALALDWSRPDEKTSAAADAAAAEQASKGADAASSRRTGESPNEKPGATQLGRTGSDRSGDDRGPGLGDRDEFVEAITAYRRRTGLVVPAEPWVFGGWVAALGGWLDYNADHRAGQAIGRAEVETTRQRLHALAADLDARVEVLALINPRSEH